MRRRSIGSMIEASPCVRMEKRHTALRPSPSPNVRADVPQPPVEESPKDVRLVEKPSIASTSSYQFGSERMIMARKGLLERQSLEDSAIMAQGEDLLASCESLLVLIIRQCMLTTLSACSLNVHPSRPGLALTIKHCDL